MIQKQVKEEMVTAMKAKDSLKVETLRGLTAAFTNELVSKGEKPDAELSDEDALTVIRREVKKRKEAFEAFKKGGREESAEKEMKERTILETYLPAMMGIDDIKKIVEAKKQELGVVDKKDMGRLMGAVMSQLKNQVEGDLVKKIVEESFN